MKTKSITSPSAAAVFLAAMSSASAALATDIAKEHLDIDIDYQSGALTLDFKTYTNMSSGVPLSNDDYSPAGNPIIVPLGNAYVIPSGSQWACLGAAGTTVYRLKQSSVSNEIWLGVNSQDVPNGVFLNNKVQLEIVQVVSAPAGARFVHYTTNTFGTPSYLLNTASGGCNDQSMDISTNVHIHGWWAFSASGCYTIRFRARGTLNDGTVIASSNVDYQFRVQ
jgi:surface-anchored protein